MKYTWKAGYNYYKTFADAVAANKGRRDRIYHCLGREQRFDGKTGQFIWTFVGVA